MILDELESSVGICYRKLILEGTSPNPELLRIRLNQVLRGKLSIKDLAQFASRILDSSNKREGTKRTIRQTIRNLEAFKEKQGKLFISMQSTSDFYDKYLEYAQNQGYSHNTIGSHIKI